MDDQTRKANLLMDIIGQTVLIIVALTFGGLFLLLFVGGAWQLISNYCHMTYYNKSRIRKLYWKFAWAIVGLLAITTVFGFLPSTQKIDIIRDIVGWGLYISLFGGGALYPFYLLISLVEFFSLINSK